MSSTLNFKGAAEGFIPNDGFAKAVAGGNEAKDVQALAADIGKGVTHGRFDLTSAVEHQHTATLTVGSAAGLEGMVTDKARTDAADKVVQHVIPTDENYERMFGQQTTPRSPGGPGGMG